MLAGYWIAVDYNNNAYVFREVYESNLLVSEARDKIKELTNEDIDILENFTFVNVDYSIHKQILEKCSGKKINKRKVNVEVANKNRKRR